MDNQQEFNNSTPPTEGSKEGKGPVVGIIIIIIILVIGAVYVFTNQLNAPVVDDEMTAEEIENLPDEATDELLQYSNSDELTDIERELMETDLDNLEADLDEIEAELIP